MSKRKPTSTGDDEESSDESRIIKHTKPTVKGKKKTHGPSKKHKRKSMASVKDNKEKGPEPDTTPEEEDEEVGNPVNKIEEDETPNISNNETPVEPPRESTQEEKIVEQPRQQEPANLVAKAVSHETGIKSSSRNGYKPIPFMFDCGAPYYRYN